MFVKLAFFLELFQLVLSQALTVIENANKKEGHWSMNRDEGSYQLSHAYNRFLDVTSDRHIKITSFLGWRSRDETETSR